MLRLRGLTGSSKSSGRMSGGMSCGALYGCGALAAVRGGMTPMWGAVSVSLPCDDHDLAFCWPLWAGGVLVSGFGELG